MFPRGRGGRGQMMSRFQGPMRHQGPGPSPYFPGSPEDFHWGCPVGRPPPQFDPGFRPRGPPPFGWRCPPPMRFHQRNQNNSPRQKGPWQTQNVNGNSRKNKPVIDKRELPENNKFFCDICDRGFKSLELHKIHTDSHEKCSVEGCSYTAASKLVQLHYKLQHKTGMAKKIWQLESKEDLQKWREERKKKFPTAANIERKSAIMADKLSRGEVLETKSFGKFKNNRFARGRGRGRGGRNMNRNVQNLPTNESTQKRSHDQTGSDKHQLSLKKTKLGVTNASGQEGKSKMADVDPLSYGLADLSGSDDESQPLTSALPHDPSDLSAGGLGNLISSYASDPEEEGAANKDAETSRTNTGDEPRSQNSYQKRKRGRKRNQNENSNFSNVNKSTLLEKLLAPEIRHERNVILQCVRYIVKKDFFGLKYQGRQESSVEGRPLCITKHVDEEIWENGHVAESVDS